MKITTMQPIYNNLSIRQILNNLPKNMIKIHKKMYVENCIFVYKNEKLGFNLDYCNTVKNANFLMIYNYLTNK